MAMPQFECNKITVLLWMACAKAQCPNTRKGMLKLEEALDDSVEPSETEVSQRYLDEHIIKALEKAKRANEECIDLGTDKVDKLCNYLGYKAFADFNSNWLRLVRLLPESIEFNHFRLVIHRDDEKFIGPQLEQVFFPQQDQNLEGHFLVGAGTNADLNALVANKMALIVLSEWDETDLLMEAISHIQSNGKDHFLLPIWHEWEVNEIKKVFPAFPEDLRFDGHQLPLLIQFLQYRAEQENKTQEKESIQNPKGIQINNSGAVFFGETHVKGEYISSRDMHITINKK